MARTVRDGWFGEPPADVRQRFLSVAGTVGLDPASSDTLWRRHGEAALDVAALVARSPEWGAPLSDVVDYSEAEVRVMARREHIVSVEDFLRRRTSLAMLESAERLAADPGVARVAQILSDGAAPATNSRGKPAVGAPDLEPVPQDRGGNR